MNELAAVAIRLVGSILENAQCNLREGTQLDVPTARYEVEQAIDKLQKIADIIDPSVSNTVEL